MNSLFLTKIFILSTAISCWSQKHEDSDTINDNNFYFGRVPRFEFSILLSRGDLHFPIGKGKEHLPFVGLGGGNIMLYPHERLKLGFLVGFSFGSYRNANFSGVYLNQGIEEELTVNMSSRFRSFRFGVKVINHTSNKRVLPYAEIYVSNISMFSYLSVDEKHPDEETDMIEFMKVEFNQTLAYHFNSGIEINLLNDKTIKNEKYKGSGLFLNIGIGYLHGRNPLNHIDISKATTDLNDIDQTEVYYKEVKSNKTSFSIYVPQHTSKLRYLNFTFGVMYRL